MRADQIARLLVETHLPMADIAASPGFPDVRHFALYFRAGKQLSPLAYRRQFGFRPAETRSRKEAILSRKMALCPAARAHTIAGKLY